MEKLFDIRANAINRKKKRITGKFMRDMSEKIDSREAKLEAEDKLMNYAAKMVKLEKRKFGIRKKITLEETDRAGTRGYLRYFKGPTFTKDENGRKFHRGPEIGLNLKAITSQLTLEEKQDRISALVRFVQTIHHEMTHVEQNIATEEASKINGISREEALQFSREFIAISHLGRDYYKEGDNYKKQFIERNARLKGFIDATKILPGANKNTMVRDALKSQLDLNDRFVETEFLELYSKSNDRDVITTSVVDRAMKADPDKYLKRCPILRYEYNKDGSRKELYQLIRGAAKDIFEIRANTHLSEEEINERVIKVKDFHSEIITGFISSAKKESLVKAQRMVGSETMEKVSEMCREHYARKKHQLWGNAVSEIKIKKSMGEKDKEIEENYQQRLLDIELRYNDFVDMYADMRDFFKKGGYNVERYTPEQVKAEEEKDQQAIERRYKRYRKDKRAKKAASKLKLEIHVNDGVNLGEMKDLRDDFANIRNQEKEVRGNCERYYTYLRAKTELIQKEQEPISQEREDI